MTLLEILVFLVLTIVHQDILKIIKNVFLVLGEGPADDINNSVVFLSQKKGLTILEFTFKCP